MLVILVQFSLSFALVKRVPTLITRCRLLTLNKYSQDVEIFDMLDSSQDVRWEEIYSRKVSRIILHKAPTFILKTFI